MHRGPVGVSVSVILLAVGLSACGSLPYDGPSAHVFKPQAKDKTALYALVDLNYPVTQTIESAPAAPLASLANSDSKDPTDLISVGDTLAISIFEAGTVGLFSHSSGAASPGPTSAADTQQGLRSVVDREGRVQIPFVGSVRVAGLTPAATAAAIKRSLARVAVDPQVTVNVISSPENMVTVIGEVKNAGRFPVSAHDDRLLDAVASAGGPVRPVGDIVVQIVRGDQAAEVPLHNLLATPEDNIHLSPQDQIRLLYRPRHYTTFGALARVSQVSFEDETLTLAAAISRVGGLDTNSANAANVLLFRFERPEVARALGVSNAPTSKGVPILYRLNMRDQNAFFIADNFMMAPGDMLYVPRSDITEAQKFFGLVNTVTQIGYNASLTSTIR